MIADSQAGDTALWRRLARFARKPYRERRKKFVLWWTGVFPRIPFPIRLPGGQWWLVRNDFCGRAVLESRFEEAEFEFAERYLQRGMTVLDIGAHHGFYTLLAARKVGPTGRVIAFEPSARERSSLSWNLHINRCKNVDVEPFALGAAEGPATLFVIEGEQTGCNSLRQPAPDVAEPRVEVAVAVRRLDRILAQKMIRNVDFIKLDAEGAELEILKGAGTLLTEVPRPVMLLEVQDIRTRPWGYEASEIIAFLKKRDYSWFRPAGNGGLQLADPGQHRLEGNFVAVPHEKLDVLMKRSLS